MTKKDLGQALTYSGFSTWKNVREQVQYFKALKQPHYWDYEKYYKALCLLTLKELLNVQAESE